MNKIKILLIKLLYDKVTYKIKSLNIYFVIANMALKKYLMYYLEIIPAIYFFYIKYSIYFSLILFNR